MDVKKIQSETESFVKERCKSDTTGHDWWHIYRVRNLALKISGEEGGTRFLIEMAALLHDVDDWKLGGSGGQAEKWLVENNFPKETISQVLEIISQVSFKGNGAETPVTSIEAAIVRDADRLDAIGAVGIARAFAYGGSNGRLLYDPDVPPAKHPDFDSYKKNQSSTINHFYEKLLLLKGMMVTATGKMMAEERHKYMEAYLLQFFGEWNGEK